MLPAMNSDLRLALGSSAGAATYSAVFGALDPGWPVWLAVLASVVIHAGGSQFAGLTALAGGAPPLAAAAVGGLVNLRLVAFGIAMGDVFGGRRQRLLAAHLVSDESVAAAVGRPPRERRRTFTVVGLLLFTGWTGGTLIGATIGAALPASMRSVLDACAVSAFAALLGPLLTDRRTGAVALVACVISGAALLWLPAGLPVLLAAVAAAVPAVLAPRKEAKRP
jgi:predicted branched-subunit amino acid permease